MRKLFAVIIVALSVCFGCLFPACIKIDEPEPTPPEPLTVADCFKDFVAMGYYKASNSYDNEPYSGEHISLSELMKDGNSMEVGRYSNFQIFTTEKAAQIEVTSISFDVVSEHNMPFQFSLGLSKDEKVNSERVEALSGELTTITFAGLHKRWTSEEAGNSWESSSGWMLGEASTYLFIELANRADFYRVDNGYKFVNFKIEFVEL